MNSRHFFSLAVLGVFTLQVTTADCTELANEALLSGQVGVGGIGGFLGLTPGVGADNVIDVTPGVVQPSPLINSTPTFNGTAVNVVPGGQFVTETTGVVTDPTVGVFGAPITATNTPTSVFGLPVGATGTQFNTPGLGVFPPAVSTSTGGIFGTVGSVSNTSGIFGGSSFDSKPFSSVAPNTGPTVPLVSSPG